ncbi:MAG: ribosomal L7Ae/L30e/S12e/Gadd45 family protein [Schwartzia sp.]|nr:ribosomal L7Ae/L30e/S12e/Gadd45 family protein [Schwartzia sp. (in: firmicutes)]
MDLQKIEGLLGMAQRAGKIVSGELAVEKAIASGQAAAVVMAANVSERTRESVLRATERKGVPVYSLFTKEMLGRCLGKEYRAVAALIDKGFAKTLEERVRS